MVRLLMGAAIALIVSSVYAHAEDLVAGKKLYVDNCRRCHGAKGQGGVGLKLAGDAAYWEFGVFKNAVLAGIDDEGKHLKKTMPVFGKVGLTTPKSEIPTDDELQNILAYLKTFGPQKKDAE
jgi:mono/diheme cytochrome c family protein